MYIMHNAKIEVSNKIIHRRDNPDLIEILFKVTC